MEENRALRFERFLAGLLHHGTMAASTVIAIGLALQWITGWPHAYSRAAINAGVAGFILLPVLRLACMLIAFFRTRDFRMVVVTVFVLTTILVACLLGLILSPGAH
jgi:uncharacterized membrane protein